MSEETTQEVIKAIALDYAAEIEARKKEAEEFGV